MAHLVGKGLSNPEIAAELFISRKAVEYHLGNIYAKCGLPGRQQLRRTVEQWHQPDHPGAPLTIAGTTEIAPPGTGVPPIPAKVTRPSASTARHHHPAATAIGSNTANGDS